MSIISVVEKSVVEKIDDFLVKYILVIGLVVQLTGVLWLSSHSGWVAQTDLWLMFPAFLSLLLNIAKWRYWRPSGLEIVLILFLLWATVSVLWSDAGKTVGDIGKTCLLILLYIYALVRLGERPERLINTLTICMLLAALGALVSLVYHYGIQHQLLGYRQYRIQDLFTDSYASFDHPIRAGLYYGMFLGMLFMLLSQQKLSPARYSLLFSGLASLAVYVVMTWSRGPWVAVLCSVFLTALLAKDKKTRWLLGIVISLVAIKVATHHYFFNHQVVDDTFSGRTMIWKTAINDILKRPWFGYGIDSSFVAHNPQGMVLYHPHCFYLQVLREFGLSGFVIFVVMLGCLGRDIVRYRKALLVKIATALLAVSLVGMLTDIYTIVNRPSDTWMYLFLPIGLVLSVRYQIRGNHCGVGK